MLELVAGFFLSGTLNESAIGLHLRALGDELACRGHDVVILTDQRKTEREDHTSNPAIYVWPSLRPTHLPDALLLNRLIRVRRPDCLIAGFGSVNLMVSMGFLHRVPTRMAY
jgi:hypothetical protein